MNLTLDGFLDRDPYSRVGGDLVRFSGMQLVYDNSRPTGQRLVSLEVGGEAIAEDRIFQATDVESTDRVFVDELIDYIRKNSPISPSLDDRIASVHGTS